MLELFVILNAGFFNLISFKSFFVYLCCNLFYGGIIFYGYKSVNNKIDEKVE